MNFSQNDIGSYKNVLDSWKYKLKTGWFDYEEM